MRVLLVLILCGIVSAVDRGPGEYIDKAPSGKYSITQRYIEPGAQDNQDVGAWEATLHFTDKSKPDATLASEPDRYLWPANYRFSPDEQWILRLQKTGSGENSALLYHVELNGQVWRLEQHLDDLAFTMATARSHLTRGDYFHITVGLVSWEISIGLLHLRIRASAEDKANPPIDQEVIYDLHKNRMVAE